MNKTKADVVVIGAGVAGLIGALECALSGKSVALIEAKPTCGGRIKTVEDEGYPVELGAEFVHGNLPLTMDLLQQAGAATYITSGSIWQFKNGKLARQEDFIEDFDRLKKRFGNLEKDKPVAEFLHEDLAGDEFKELRFSLSNYVEGYYAADTTRSSTWALRDELTKGDEEQYRIEGGYRQLIWFLEEKCLTAGVQFFLSQPVQQVQWKKGAVTAVTGKGSFEGKKALVTVPMGVLQREGITFYPALPHLKQAAQALGFGHVLKLVFRFASPFWKESEIRRRNDLANLGFLFSREEIPTWWTHFPKPEPILTGWLGGPKAGEFGELPAGVLEQKAISALHRIFVADIGQGKQRPVKMHFYNWSADPHFGGAYSYEVVGGGQRIKEMMEPVEGTIFFAGEGLHPGKEIGTVEAALQSGKTTAKQIVTLFAD